MVKPYPFVLTYHALPSKSDDEASWPKAPRPRVSSSPHLCDQRLF